jgi:hypothetical protein
VPNVPIAVREVVAAGIAWCGYGLFYLAVFLLVVGVPVGLLVLLARWLAW